MVACASRLLDWFRSQVAAAGGGNYQTLINDALKEYARRKSERLEETLRRVMREELGRPRKSGRI